MPTKMCFYCSQRWLCACRIRACCLECLHFSNMAQKFESWTKISSTRFCFVVLSLM